MCWRTSKTDAASVFMSVTPSTVGDKRWKHRKVAVSNSCANTDQKQMQILRRLQSYFHIYRTQNGT